MRAPILFVLLFATVALSAGACAAAAAPVAGITVPAPVSMIAPHGEGELTLDILELI